MATFCRFLTRAASLQTIQGISGRSSLLVTYSQFSRKFLHSSFCLQGILKFSEKHEYLDITDNKAKLGITEHAQRELGDVVYIELPQTGAELEIEDVACTLESVKAVADVYMPISGQVTQVNEKLGSTPELVNTSPLQDGWLIEVEITKPEQLDSLMDEEAYNNFLNTTE